jgi:ATP-dependent DNA ligase
LLRLLLGIGSAPEPPLSCEWRAVIIWQAKKIDGYWSRFVRQGDVCKQQTRVVSKVTGTYGESQDKIPFIFNFLEKVTTGDTVLLGELYTLSRNVSDMKRIMGAKTERALARQVDNIDKVRFYVFDVLYWNGQSFMKTEFSDRARLPSPR